MRNVFLFSLALSFAAPALAGSTDPDCFSDDTPVNTTACSSAIIATPEMLAQLAASGEADLLEAPDPSPAEIMKGATKVAADWSNLGALAGAASLILLLTQFSKMKWAKKLLDDRGLGWARPLIALALGAAGAAVASLQTGAPLGASLAAGLMAAVTGVGGHEVFRMASKKERKKVRVDKTAVSAAKTAMKTAASEKLSADASASAVTQELKRIGNLPEKEQLEELAKLLSKKV